MVRVAEMRARGGAAEVHPDAPTALSALLLSGFPNKSSSDPTVRWMKSEKEKSKLARARCDRRNEKRNENVLRYQVGSKFFTTITFFVTQSRPRGRVFLRRCTLHARRAERTRRYHGVHTHRAHRAPDWRYARATETRQSFRESHAAASWRSAPPAARVVRRADASSPSPRALPLCIFDRCSAASKYAVGRVVLAARPGRGRRTLGRRWRRWLRRGPGGCTTADPWLNAAGVQATLAKRPR